MVISKKGECHDSVSRYWWNPFFRCTKHWVDLWTDVNGYKIGLQIKPSPYKSANLSIYMGKAKASEEKGHKEFLRDFGGKVFIITPVHGTVSADIERKIVAERNLLLKMPPKE